MSAWEDVLLDSGDQRKPAEWWWAYVTGVDPLRIRRELETHPIGSTPSTLVAGLQVGDKVRVVNYLGQALIVGRAGGAREVTVTADVSSGMSGSFKAHRQGLFVALTGEFDGSLPGVDTEIARLPVGFRPQQRFKAWVGGSNDVNSRVRLISVTTGGAIKYLGNDSLSDIGPGGSDLWISGVVFVAD